MVSHFFEAKIFETLLYNKEAGLSSDQNKALYLDFCIRYKHLPRNSLEFKDTIKSDPYFNSLRLKFGYAITCHKAQGSEWNHVFVKCKTQQSQLTAEYFRWFYTAITRTTQKLYLLDPPHLKLGAGVKVVQTLGIGLKQQPVKVVEKHTLKQADEKSSQEMAESTVNELNTFGIPESAPFLRTILDEIRKLILNKGIEIDGITHNNYQEAYIFNRGIEYTRVDLLYNSKSKVTGIKAPQKTELSVELIGLLSPLLGKQILTVGQINPGNFEFEKPFLNEFHHRLTGLTEDLGITIQNVVPQQWSQRYTFTKDQQVAVYDVFYNSKQQFTKCQPLITACSPGTLTGEVETILTEGLSA